ncbi:MAG: FapA family protein [bacterium]
MDPIKITISEDNMSVKADFYPPDLGGTAMSLQDAVSFLREREINVDINEDSIKSALDTVLETSEPVCDVNVAEGLEPQNGKDAWIEYFTNAKQDLVPAEKEDGGVDFYGLGLVEPVEKDQELALYHPPVKGEDGYDVFGKIRQGTEGNPCKFPAGENTYASPDNPNLVVAKIDGNVSIVNGVVVNSEAYIVKGDVDFLTGNISSKGPLIVKGDVQSGFGLDIERAIEVGGCVEDAVITSGADILIKRGFIGKSKGIIHAEGNVNIGFVRNQAIYSRESIHVAREVVDARLHAKNKIHVGGRRISIVGGYTIAGEAIEVECLGNMYGASTVVEVGYDYKMVEDVENDTRECHELKKKLEELNARIKNLEMQHKRSNREDHSIAALLKEKLSIDQELAAIEERIRLLKRQIYTPSKARVKVKRLVHPGVEIIINKSNFRVKEEMQAKTFILSEKDGVIPV